MHALILYLSNCLTGNSKSMSKIPIIVAITLLSVSLSCSKKTSEAINSIPGHASLVASVHPEQIYNKGQVGSLESLTKSIRNEIILSIARDPFQSGIDMTEYIYCFIYFMDEEPVIGITANLKNRNRFSGMISKLNKKGDVEVISHKGYEMITLDSEETAMAWNDDQVIFLTSPGQILSADNWQSELVRLYELQKEESIATVVNFRDFAGKMKDVNIWAAGDDLKKVMEKTRSFKDLTIDLPVTFEKNYSQVFIEFADGLMNIHSEIHLNDDIKKATEMLLLAKDQLNPDLLKMSPGNDLLMALAFSLKTDRMAKVMKNINPSQLEGMSDKVEQATGVPGREMLEALSGDFVFALNGAAEGSAIPVEVLIGVGLNDEALQERLLDRVGNMAQVEKEGDFFMINAAGMQIYSGIMKGIWVITNVPGYKDAITGKGLKKNLMDSEFNAYAGGSVGMYMNLDLTTYPVAIQGMMASGGAPKTLELLTESFDYMGMEASNYEGNIILKTSDDEENSLYTLLRLAERLKEGN